jgi:hypothetical protein
MTHLNASAISILQALFGMGVLTFAMGVWMSAVRMPAMKRAGVPLQDAQHTRDLAARLPSAVRQVADNFNHLFESPTLFYAVGLAIIVAGLADPIYAGAAWAYLGLRTLHSLVQAAYNRVWLRAWLYGLSWAALAVMIFRPLVTLFA